MTDFGLASSCLTPVAFGSSCFGCSGILASGSGSRSNSALTAGTGSSAFDMASEACGFLAFGRSGGLVSLTHSFSLAAKLATPPAGL